jgi:hypothetical protein
MPDQTSPPKNPPRPEPPFDEPRFAGPDSTAIDEATQLALIPFEAAADPLFGAAKELATARVEELTRALMRKLFVVNPAAHTWLEEPAVCYALQQLQTEYCKSGDQHLGEVLIELFIDRVQQPQRSMQQIVLDEALRIAPKLTARQIGTLTVVFLFRYFQHSEIGSHAMLAEFFDSHVQPFTRQLAPTVADYQHLQFSGCGSLNAEPAAIETIIADVYLPLFVPGVTIDDIEVRQMLIDKADRRFFMPALNDPNRWQVRARNQAELDRLCNMHRINNRDRASLSALLNHAKASSLEVAKRCVELRPYMAQLFDTWNNTDLKRVALTNIGIAIARANVQWQIGTFPQLNAWIADPESCA